MIYGSIFCIRNKDRKVFSVFPFYSLSSLIQLTVSWLHIHSLFLAVRNWFPFLELFAFLFFFNSILSTKWVKKSLPILLIFFLLDNIILNISTKNADLIELGHLYSIENFLLLLPSIVYFREKFQSKSETILPTDASFWIATGILLLAISSMPISIFLWMNQKRLDESWQEVFAPILLVPYIIMNFLFIKGFTCKLSTITK